MTKRHEDLEPFVNSKKNRFAILANYNEDGDKDDDELNVEPASGDLSMNGEQTNQTSKEEELSKEPPSIQIKKESLIMYDVNNFCHSFVARYEVKRPLWFKSVNFKPSQFVLLRINCSKDQSLGERKEFKFVEKFFKGKGYFVGGASNSYVYWSNLLNVAVTRRTRLKAFFEKHEDPLKELGSNGDIKLVLLSSTQHLVNFNYPIQAYQQQKDHENSVKIVPTKHKYAKVTKDSPIFVLDCEMCVTELEDSELTRVTLINEDGKTLIDTFVKPHNKITNYLTCFSGVTEEALKDVSICLKDVQEAFRRLLPPDAILCGHTVENDLKALRLSHPYCIDVGRAYNLFSCRYRTPLRALVYYLFNEMIQTSDSGHCSYQDSLAALRLLKLKLEHGIEFGNSPLGFDYLKWAEEQKFTECAQRFAKVIANPGAEDFVKDQYREVTLPKPRQVSKCLICSTPMMSQCYIEKCPCSVNAAEYCCLCVAKDAEKNFDTKLVPESEQFDLAKTIEDFKKYLYRPAMKELLAKTEDAGKVMIARYLKSNEKVDEMSTDNVHCFDMTPLKSIAQINEAVLDNKIPNYNLCLLEWDAPDKLISQINEFIETVHRQVALNGVYGCLFSSPKKSLLYLNVKSE